MRTKVSITGRLQFPLRLLALFFVACHLGQESKVEDTLSFTKQYESLSKFDTVRIEVRDEAGRTLAIVYHGKVDSLQEIQNLSVPGWNGGPIDIVISGYQAGNPDPVYQEEKKYNGTTRTTDASIVLIHPNPGLSAGSLLLQINEGQNIPLPKVEITPSNLVQTALQWSSSNPQVAKILEDRLVAGMIGSAQLTAKLVSHPTKTLVFEIQVQADPRVPASITLDRDTLHLAENGSQKAFAVDIKPATASNEVFWRLEDSSIAALRSDGSFQGLKRGKTRAVVASKLRASVQDFGFIVVSEPVPVTAVRFLNPRTTLYVGGSPEVLMVEVLPVNANPEVEFTLSNALKASLAGDTLVPLSEGTLSVFVRSREDTSKADTLEVTIEVPERVTRVEASDAALTLYVRGDSKTVTAKIFPSNAPQGVRWLSLSPAIATVGQATGTLQPLRPGLTLVVAVSQADSSRKDTILVSVRQDIPVLAVGNDTTISSGQTVTYLPTVTQEYGQIVMYKWDLDGNLQWDDSAAAIGPKSFKYDQPREYGVRFYVRDTEGNEATKTRRITVVTSATLAITSPPDNSHTNQRVISVEWSVNGKLQDSLTSHTLSTLGPNLITRSARDSAGMEVSQSITVHYDTVAPSKPSLTGTSPTNVKPRWAWSSGGGGSGDFRFRLGDGNFPAVAPSVRDTAHTLAADPVSGTTYTLFVQERDLAGNWSPWASLAIVYNVTQPVVGIQSPRASGTHYSAAAAVTLKGTASGPVAISKVTYRVGAADAVNAIFASGSWSTPALSLPEGVATVVLVTATDVANNTGDASLTLFHDKTAPSPPIISSAPPAISSTRRATFGWSHGNDGSGGSGLNGNFQYRLNGEGWVSTRALSAIDITLEEGTNIFEVQEQDSALNWSGSATAKVIADTRGPSLNIVFPAPSGGTHIDTAKVIVLVGGTVLDSGIGVKEVTCELAGASTGALVAGISGSEWSVSPTFNPGSTTIRCTGVDNFDKSGISSSVTVTIAIPLPKISNLSVPSGMVLNKSELMVSYDVTTHGNVTRESSGFRLAEGLNNFTISTTASNIVGQKGLLAVTYFRRSNVVFVDREAKGISDGSSWMDAFPSIESGLKSEIFLAGGAQMWVSRGEYGNSESTSLTFPSSGKILGGFNALVLPSDTSSLFRDIEGNISKLLEFKFSMTALSGRVEFNGLHIDGGFMKALLTESPGDGSGIISYINCNITKKWSLYNWYEISSNNPIRWEMIGCTIGGDFPDGNGPNNFNLYFNAPGDFYSRNSRFIRNRQSFTRGPFLIMNQESGLMQRARLEGCELNISPSTENNDLYQITSNNVNSTITISGSKVLGGASSIETVGKLFYGEDNVTIP